jgi:hypothetical protein
VIPNQGGYEKAWTSYFVGQTHSVRHPERWSSDGLTTATINSDGSISFVFWFSGVAYRANSQVPTGRNGIAATLISGDTTYSFTAWPISSSDESFNGLPPHDWTLDINVF